MLRLRMSASHAWIAARVCSVISNCTGRPVFLLNDGRAVTDPTADADILDLQPHEIATPKFAVDREVEQGEVAGSALHLEPDPDRPHVLRLQRALLPNEAPFVPGIATRHRRLVAIEHDRLLGTDRALPAPVRPRPAGHTMPGARFVIETYPSFVGGPTGPRHDGLGPSLWLTVIMTIRHPGKTLVVAACCARR